jgi:nucleoside-diphosphate-sugar epimerase
MRVNAQGSERLCQAAVRAGSVQRFILMSSVAAVVPTDAGTIEEDAPPNPASPYGRSKLAAENAVRRVCNGSGCDYVFLRPTLVYGSGNPGNMLRLQRLVKLGLPLPLASINNRRSFCFIGNLVSAICSLMCHPDAANQAFTVCDNEKVSTPQLIRLIAECCGRNTWLVPLAPGIIGSLARICDHLEKRLCIHLPFDTETWCRLSGSLIGSNAKLHDRCGWSPPYPLQVGLRLTLGTSD